MAYIVPITKPPTPSDDKRWRAVDARMLRLGYAPDALIEVLHTAQQSFGYLDDVALTYVGQTLGVPLSKVYGVATFYAHFTIKPKGKHLVRLCDGTACHVKDTVPILRALQKRLGGGEQPPHEGDPRHYR